MNRTLNKRLDKAKTILRNAGNLACSQQGLLIARQCAGYGKLGYNTRTMPPQDLTATLQDYSGLLKDCLSDMAGSVISEDSWSLAQLGFQEGGVGLRDPVMHAQGAYVASFSAAGTLAKRIWPAFDGADTAGWSRAWETTDALNAKLQPAAQVALGGDVLRQKK